MTTLEQLSAPWKAKVRDVLYILFCLAAFTLIPPTPFHGTFLLATLPSFFRLVR